MQKLIDWTKSGTVNFRVLSFSFEGKYSEYAIYQKLLDLGSLKEEEDVTHHSSSSTLTSKRGVVKGQFGKN